MAMPVSYYIVWTFYTQKISDGQSGITLSLNYSTLYSYIFVSGSSHC